MNKFDSIFLCMGAMGYSPSLYLNHELKRAWFCNIDLIKYDDEYNEEGMEVIKSTLVFDMDAAKKYGKEIDYTHACDIFNKIKDGFAIIEDKRNSKGK